MKRISALLLALVLLFTCAACGDNSAGSSTGTPAPTSSSPAPTSSATPSPSPSAEPGPGSPTADTLVTGELATASATYTYGKHTVERYYYYYLPSTYQAGDKLPVVLSLHGSGENAEMQLNEGKWTELAEEEGFIVIAPEAVAIHKDRTLSAQGKSLGAIGQGDASNIRWFAASSDPISVYGVDDVAYLCDLIDLFVDLGCADPARVYSTGLSHGAFMSIRLAVEAPEYIAGIGSVAGLITAEMAKKLTDKDVKLVFINGTADPIVPHVGMIYSGVTWAHPVDDSIDLMLKAYGYTDLTITETQLEDVDTTDRTNITRYAYTAGDGSVPAVKYMVNSGGHTWPGGTQYESAAWIGHLCKDAQASRLIWDELKDVTNPNR